MSIPPAHKRLVPRKPRKDGQDSSPPSTPEPAPAAKSQPPAPAQTPRSSRPASARPAGRPATIKRSETKLPQRPTPKPRRAPAPRIDDEHEVTAERPAVRPARPEMDPLQQVTVRQPDDLDEIEMTVERQAVTPDPDDEHDEHDAAETFAILRPQPARSHADVRRPFPDAEPTATHTGDAPPLSPRELHLLQDLQGHAFAEVEPTVLGDQPLPPAHRPMVRLQDLVEIDANAFAELEPTSLKPATGSIAGMEDRPLTHVSPAERGFLAAMAEGHEPSRLKYVEWLERRGERARAEYLRLDHELFTMNPRDIRYEDTYARLRQCAERISVDFRSRVARSTIEGCMMPGGRCPSYWRALSDTADDVRQCTACGEHVYYCVTLDLARMRLAEGQLVAIDVTCQRWPGDLQAPVMQLPHCGSCGYQLPQGTRFCPHCGMQQS